MLESLSLHGCTLLPQTTSLLCHTKMSVSLRSIDFSSSSNITSPSIRSILSHCSNLECLNVAGTGIGDEAFEPVPTGEGLRSSRPRKRRRRISSDVSYKVSGLANLVVSGCCKLTNRSIEWISVWFPCLLYFDCSHCPKVSDIVPLVSGCRSIKHLNINGCHIDTETTDLCCLEALEVLQVCTGKKISFKCLMMFCVTHFPVPCKFSGSSLLSSGFCRWIKACGDVLSELRLRNKYSMYPALLTECIQHCTGGLRILDLYGATVGPSFVTTLLSMTPCQNTLHTIDLTHCRNLSQGDLVALAEAGLPSLRSLAMSFNGKCISPDLLRKLGSRCPCIKHLSLSLPMRGILLLLVHADVVNILGGFKALECLELWCVGFFFFFFFF